MIKNVFESIYHTLFQAFGPQYWWPAESPWEMATGAILTQNTNWQNVERAIANLKAMNLLAPEQILQTDLKDLSEAIRPAGYFNVKAIRLKHLATWWVEKAAWAADPASPVKEVRKALLEVKGVGPETADSILLYAWGKPIFVVDAYTRRIFARHRLIHPDASYAEIQETVMAALPEDVNVFNEYHALLVRLAKEYCRTSPQCQGCPLAPPPA